MRPNLSSELLLGLMHASPEQMAAIGRVLALSPKVLAHGHLADREHSEPVSEDVARQLFALIKELEIEGRWRKAPVLQVFRLYCMENLSRDEVAKRYGCVPSLVTLRLKAIEKKLGRKPSELRQFSSHFETMEDSISDSRAKKINRSGLADDSEENGF